LKSVAGQVAKQEAGISLTKQEEQVRLEKELEATKFKLSNASVLLQEVEETCERQKRELQDLHIEHTAACNSIQQLEMAQESAEKLHTEEIEGLVDKLQPLLQENSSLVARQLLLESQVVNLTKQVQAGKTRQEGETEEGCQADVKTYQQQIKEQADRLQQQQAANADQAKQLARLKSSLSESEKRYNDKSLLYASLEEELETVRGQLNHANEALSAQESVAGQQVAQAHAELRKLQEVQKEAHRAQELTVQVEQLRASLLQSQKLNSELAANRSSDKGVVETMMAEVKQLQNELSDYQAAEREHVRVGTRNQALVMEIGDLQAELKEAGSELRALRQAKEEQAARLAKADFLRSEGKKLETQAVRKRDQEISQLTQQLRKLAADCKLVEQRHSDSQQQLEAALLQADKERLQAVKREQSIAVEWKTQLGLVLRDWQGIVQAVRASQRSPSPPGSPSSATSSTSSTAISTSALNQDVGSGQQGRPAAPEAKRQKSPGAVAGKRSGAVQSRSEAEEAATAVTQPSSQEEGVAGLSPDSVADMQDQELVAQINKFFAEVVGLKESLTVIHAERSTNSQLTQLQAAFIQEQDTQLDQLGAVVRSQEAKLRELQAECDGHAAKLQQQVHLDSHIQDELKQQLAKFQAQTTELEGRNTSLQHQLEQAGQPQDELKQQLADSRVRQVELTEKLSALEAKAAKFEKHASLTLAEVRRLHLLHQASEANLADAKQAAKAAASLHAEQQRAATEEKQAIIEQLASEKEEKVAMLTAKLATERADREAAIDRLTTEKANIIKVMSAEKEALAAEMAGTLEAQQHAADKTLNEQLQACNASFEEKMVEQRALFSQQKEDLEREISLAKETVDEALSQGRETAQQKVEVALAAAEADRNKLVSQLTNSIAELKGEREDLLREKTAMYNRLTKELSLLGEEKTRAIEERIRAQSDAQHAKLDMQAAKAKCAKLEGLRPYFSELEASLKTLQTALKKETDAKEALQSTLAANEKKLSRFQTVSEEMSRALSNKQKEVGVLSAQLQDYIMDKKRLHEEKQNLMATLEKYKSEHKLLSKSFNSFKERSTDLRLTTQIASIQAKYGLNKEVEDPKIKEIAELNELQKQQQQRLDELQKQFEEKTQTPTDRGCF